MKTTDAAFVLILAVWPLAACQQYHPWIVDRFAGSGFEGWFANHPAPTTQKGK